MALGFAEAGADVVVASRKLEQCQQVADEVSVLGTPRLWPFAAMSATGTNARNWWTRLSPGSGGSTSWSTMPASRRSPPRLPGVDGRTVRQDGRAQRGSPPCFTAVGRRTYAVLADQ